MKKRKAIISIIVVFLLGSLAGALITHEIYQHRIESFIRGEPKRELIVRRLSHQLNLDAAQLSQLRVIVEETYDGIKNVRKQIKPQIEAILESSQNRVRAILLPDQLEKYEKIIAERKKKREKEENTK
jgi:flagellar basal body-associated protein FliL